MEGSTMSCGKCETCACAGKKDPVAYVVDDTGFLDAEGKQIVALSPIGRGNTAPTLAFAIPGDGVEE
ncbi:hypothetical protein CF95_gp130 [Erwinia phage PhiEaH1]|uniref:Uncharacterized protein n=1 Tax=Erwinia phage PhiEaH1 TaxID=1401669 RepID=W8CZF1_9CAUD|nr:hypothetical protein CF95_gp130 [Erwinia phage PhiEaH1]AGX01852.1 hypothetical protein [Erwinia phage PhiEaH1]